VKIPNVFLGDFGYEGTIELRAWYEFLGNSKGVYDLDIGGDMVQENPSITQEHVAAYDYAVENQNIIRDSIISILMQKYPELQKEYDYEEDESEYYMPNIKSAEDFKKLIGLSTVHIMNVFKDGIAYMGYEFTCTWDEEHGLGVMMYKSNVVAFGGADTSCLTWIAEEDLEKQ
jgi:hypothetical protein